jgi:hypothetical protein
MTNPKKATKQVTTALPARVTISLDTLRSLDPQGKIQFAVMDFPLKDQVKAFTDAFKGYLNRDLNWDDYPPYRRLNNALLLDGSSVVHGFESYDDIRRMLAISQPVWQKEKVIDAVWNRPSPERVSTIVGTWLKQWSQNLSSLRDFLDTEPGQSAWNSLINAVENCKPTWEVISIETVVQDITAESGLIYQALPSLLATLLHGKTSTITGTPSPIPIIWRKVCDGSKRGLSLISQPILAQFEKRNEAFSGYFAYKVEFRVQTYTGRTNNSGSLLPLVFIDVHCQRYPHKALTKHNYGRTISLLFGRTTHSKKADQLHIEYSPFIKLNASWSKDGFVWDDNLADLLAAIQANPLELANSVANNPAAFGSFRGMDIGTKDLEIFKEYNIVHAEGYRYGKSKHTIPAGFSMEERGEVTEKILEPLRGFLCPDEALRADDHPIPKGIGIPGILLNMGRVARPKPKKKHEKLTPRKTTVRRPPKYINATRKALQSALGFTDKGKLHLAIIYQNPGFLEAAKSKLKELLWLSSTDDFPNELLVVTHHRTKLSLHTPLNSGKLNPATDANHGTWKDQMKEAHRDKVDEWNKFLSGIEWTPNTHRFLLIETLRREEKDKWKLNPETNKKDKLQFDSSQGIKGAVRHAAKLVSAHSQLMEPLKGKKLPRNEHGEVQLKGSNKGRLENALAEIILRQPGALYGTPAQLYSWLGIPSNIASNLDVIAFYLRRTNAQDVRYALAVRLTAEGKMSVILPHLQEHELSVLEADLELGNIFINARNDEIRSGKRQHSQIKLKGQNLIKFVQNVTIRNHTRPTLILIRADGWRNERTRDPEDRLWGQLKNEHLGGMINELNFGDGRRAYKRNDTMLANLLGIIRIRAGNETPQYITNRAFWESDVIPFDFPYLTGFVEQREGMPLHYYSAGGLPHSQKKQAETRYQRVYKVLPDERAGFAMKHPQLVEFVPFFVHSDFSGSEKLLCRVPHFLRVSPSFTGGNLLLPYPMHTAYKLVEDQFPILGLD